MTMSKTMRARGARLIPLFLVGSAIFHEGTTAQSARSDQFTVTPDPNAAKAASPAPQRAAGYDPVKAYEFTRLMLKTPSPARLTVGTAEFEFYYGANTIHVIRPARGAGGVGGVKGAAGIPLYRGRILTQISAPKAKKARETITFTSDNPDILRFPSPEKGQYEILREGSVIVTAAVGSQSVRIPFHVVSLYIRNGITTKELYESLGPPDQETKVVLTYPEQLTVDGLRYTAKAGGPTIIRHWQYKRFPGAVLRIGSNNISNDILLDCVTPAIEALELKQIVGKSAP
jgi:hypothetical protein